MDYCFFFKQKTAYEMRISDWSSDVCSSDLDGIHLKVRLDQEKLCLLVMLGVRADGRKELVAITDGYRESAESWANIGSTCAPRIRSKAPSPQCVSLGRASCRERVSQYV